MKPYNPPRFWEKRGRTYPEKLENEDFMTATAEHRRVIGEMLNEVPIKRFIDVGCGSGRLFDLYRPFPVVVGIDMSSSMLYHARKVGNSLKFEHLILLRGSATNLPFKSKSFDCALTSEVLLHIPPLHILSALRETSRISQFTIYLEFYSSRYEDPEILKEERRQLASWNFLHEYPRLFEQVGSKLLKRIELGTIPQTCFLVANESPGPQ
ncbi:MAG: class I SAM-dependent methyltransferase [Thermoplasmata archaeon]